MQEQQADLELSQQDLPNIIPIMPLLDVALFPKMVLPLIIKHEQGKKLIDDAMESDRIIGFLVSKKGKEEENPTAKDLYKFGCGAIIIKMANTDDGRIQLLVQGIKRFQIKKILNNKPYITAEIEQIEEPYNNNKEIKAISANLMKLYENLIAISPGLPKEMIQLAKSIDEPAVLADMIASTTNASPEEKQKILEITNLKKRLKEVTKLIAYQLELLQLGSKIQSQIKEDMNQKQKEYYLRQQLKAIQEELGETDDRNLDIEEYKEKIEKSNMPIEARKEAERELKRLTRMHPSSSEYTVASTYLDWMTNIPWDESSNDNLDIKGAKKILDDDHFGLEKPKKRIIEYLAVRKLKPDSKGPIICFAGPPGTGKTSLGKSIANALGREFVRIALGGVRDEAEIRGHRRTYVGALPGRIIQGIRRAETNNPVFVLDEIDKLGNDFRGDPSSALLEVLDPEQNNSFTDHYLDVPFDLTKVMFITTANVVHTIPPALRDRMEIIELSGYTEDEKIKIANKYLIPRQREAHGLNSRQISFTKGAIKHIISDYTREAGLRNLEREIASVIRGVASEIAQEQSEKVSIQVNTLSKYLGPAKITSDSKPKAETPGVVLGLAWTPAGGDVLYVETAAMKGKKGLILTGQMGDVMKESVSAALSFIRSNQAKFGIEENFFETHEIHIHVPAGAIPKDGPSAGVTMLSAITSLATNKKVVRELAMTGEITLRGEVLPVGGIKEKIIAAHRMGVKTVILPKDNEKDIIEIPKKVKKEMTFHFVKKMMDVIKIALGDK